MEPNGSVDHTTPLKMDHDPSSSNTKEPTGLKPEDLHMTEEMHAKLMQASDVPHCGKFTLLETQIEPLGFCHGQTLIALFQRMRRRKTLSPIVVKS